MQLMASKYENIGKKKIVSSLKITVSKNKIKKFKDDMYMIKSVWMYIVNFEE